MLILRPKLQQPLDALMVLYASAILLKV